MDIVFIITSLNVGGAETQVVQLAKKLKEKGLKIGIVALIESSDFDSELLSMNIPVVFLNMRRGVPNPLAILSILKIFKNWKPTIVHSHMFHANIITRIAMILYRTSVNISTIHSIDEGGHFRELAYRLSDSFCNLTTHVCKIGAERYKSIAAIPDGKILFVPNGLDVNRYCPNEQIRSKKRSELKINDKFVWLAVGNLLSEKNYPNMLQAFSILLKYNHLNAILLIAGKGPLDNNLRVIAKKLNISDNIHFLGLRRDVKELMNAADAYVMSSSIEGLAMVLLEASSSGLPVVATDVGGNREIVIDCLSGFLVSPNNSIALANAMERIMNMKPTELKDMGSYGRNHIEQNYNMDNIVSNWIAIYNDMTNALSHQVTN
jgi:glycosyltransferase involved in cell wall biosynthesis